MNHQTWNILFSSVSSTRSDPPPSWNSWAILLMRSTYFSALVRHWNIDINTFCITMQTHAGTTGRTFSIPGGGVRERVQREKRALQTCVFTFMIFHISVRLLLPWYLGGNSLFSIKGPRRKPKKESLTWRKLTVLYLSCCTMFFKCQGSQSLQSLCKHIQKCICLSI